MTIIKKSMITSNIITFFSRTKLAMHFLRHITQYVGVESYYNDSERKSKINICCDYLKMIYKYGAIDKFYYVYGLDRKEAVLSDYMPYVKFLELREKKNQVRTVGQTAYSYVCLLRDKTLFNWIADRFLIPIPKTMGIVSGGIFKNGTQTISLADYLRQLFEPKSLFLKDFSGICGRGAMAIDKKNGKYYLNNEETTINEIVAKISYNTSYIVQDRVVQHQLIDAIYPKSLNTLRVVSVIYGDKVEILGTLLRIGANDKVVDNWASGGVAVGVDGEGKLMKWGFYKPGYGTKTDLHPDTGVVFENYQLPFWKETIQLVKDTHLKMSCIPTVGWDIALTENGPIIIEGNDDYDGALLQACTGGKRKEFMKYYSNNRGN